MCGAGAGHWPARPEGRGGCHRGVSEVMSGDHDEYVGLLWRNSD